MTSVRIGVVILASLMAMHQHAFACWDGYRAADTERHVELEGTNTDLTVAHVLDVANWIERYAALYAAAASPVAIVGGGGYTTLDLREDPGFFVETNMISFRRVGRYFNIRPQVIRQAATRGGEVWTVQVLSGSELTRIVAARDSLRQLRENPEPARYPLLGLTEVRDYTAVRGQSFIEVGGFPAQNSDEWVVSEDGQHRLISGLFLTQHAAAERSQSLRALGLDTNVRRLRSSESVSGQPISTGDNR